jgi:hypothetical protein
VRVFDPATRGTGRFHPETRSEAAAIPDEALPILWAHGLRASTAVVEAQRGEVAVTIRRKLEPDPAHPKYFITEPGSGVRFTWPDPDRPAEYARPQVRALAVGEQRGRPPS